MSYKHRYTVLDGGVHWRVVKMDRDHEVEGGYNVTKIRPDEPRYRMVCDCFAGTKSTCRHREIVDLFLVEKRVGSRWSYDYDKQKWYPPLQSYFDAYT